MFYFERWANHHKSQLHAVTLEAVIIAKVKLLHKNMNYPHNELEFLQTAIQEVIKCK